MDVNVLFVSARLDERISLQRAKRSLNFDRAVAYRWQYVERNAMVRICAARGLSCWICSKDINKVLMTAFEELLSWENVPVERSSVLTDSFERYSWRYFEIVIDSS